MPGAAHRSTAPTGLIGWALPDDPALMQWLEPVPLDREKVKQHSDAIGH